MSANTNPNVVTDGLVLCLDNYNEQSYLGEPTTNVFTEGSSIYSNGGYSATQASSMPVNLNIDNLSSYYLTVDAPATWVSEGKRVIYYGTQVNMLSTSTSYRGSFYARKIGGSGTAIRYGWYGNSTVYNGTITGSWQRYEFSATTNSAYAGLELGSVSGDIEFEVAAVQAETGTRHTKYVGSGDTRSATDGWQDLSGNDNHADLTQLSYSATNVPGTNVNSFSFDGTDDYITKSSFVFGNNTARTISLWMNLNDVTNFSVPLVLSDNANSYKWQYFHVQDAKVWWMFGDNSGYNERGYSDAILTTGDWYNVAITMDITRSAGDTAKVYSNGVSKGITYQNNDRNSIYNASDMNLHIGAAHYGSGWDYEMEGSISNVVIYDRALSATEVLQNYNAHKARYGL